MSGHTRSAMRVVLAVKYDPKGAWMSKLFERATRLARSPQGRRFAHQARRWVQDPDNRRKLAALRSRRRGRY